jgi:hypothetical protein
MLKIEENLSPCLIKNHAMKTYGGNGVIAPRILDLGTKWRYLLERRLGGPQSRSVRGGEGKNCQPPPGIEP